MRTLSPKNILIPCLSLLISACGTDQVYLTKPEVFDAKNTNDNSNNTTDTHDQFKYYYDTNCKNSKIPGYLTNNISFDTSTTSTSGGSTPAGGTTGGGAAGSGAKGASGTTSVSDGTMTVNITYSGATPQKDETETKCDAKTNTDENGKACIPPQVYGKISQCGMTIVRSAIDACLYATEKDDYFAIKQINFDNILLAGSLAAAPLALAAHATAATVAVVSSTASASNYIFAGAKSDVPAAQTPGVTAMQQAAAAYIKMAGNEDFINEKFYAGLWNATLSACPTTAVHP